MCATLQMLRTHKVSSFDETEEKSNANQTAEAITSRCSSGDGTPDDHAGGKIDGWHANFVQKQVGWDSSKLAY
jgi:hypothetical protein